MKNILLKLLILFLPLILFSQTKGGAGHDNHWKLHAEELFNLSGDFKIQPDAQGDVILFGDSNVGDAIDGKELRIWRKAVEGNTYLRLYITESMKAMLHGNADFTLQGQTSFTINSVTDDIFFKVGDNAGNKKVYFKDSDGNNVASIDSDGNMIIIGTVDGRDLSIDGMKLDDIASGAGVPTKEFFISAGASILSSNTSYDTPNNTYQASMADAVTFARCFFAFRIPSDFSIMTPGYPKVAFKQGTGGTGNYRIAFDGRNGGVGEQMANELDSIVEYTMSAPGQTDELWEEDISACFNGLSLTAGDYVGLQIQRDSDDVLDTFVGDLDVVGIVIKYY